ncbi:MBL fold metallo-hydrolase [Oscillospiraceae bacterium Marseille-Q3528]|nr:MBL fold metallo-hydrolase [Oscillospiraceae bacterium Marseille-Q3528]WNV56822.1 MBL fold metallo-hydrolase [Oscillospiraceae bacterium NTUH-002-81]
MEITYIGHSGFLVELEDRCLLFDYYQGEIPPVAFSRPLYVFVSHRHQDHYNRAVLDFRREGRDVTYIFSGDIMTGKKAEANGILRMRAGDEKEIDGMHVWTLRSTDVGVAFVVEIGGKRLYHAGDLNWWHWEGESEAENRQMEKDYKREIGRLEGLPIDAAFVVLDPRQENAFAVGFDWFMRHTDTRQVFPMHQWGDYGITEKLCGMELSAPYRQKIRPIHGPGEKFQI